VTKYDHFLLAVVKLAGCIAICSAIAGTAERLWREGVSMNDMLLVAFVYGVYVIVEHVRGK